MATSSIRFHRSFPKRVNSLRNKKSLSTRGRRFSFGKSTTSQTMAAVYGRPTVNPAPIFNPERAAMKLQRAMRGIGTDERIVIEVLTGHANFQRQEIKKKYKTMYGRKVEQELRSTDMRELHSLEDLVKTPGLFLESELAEDLKAELGGNFEDVCLALLVPPVEFLVDCLQEALKGLGTDEWCLIDILCTSKNSEIEAIKHLFQEKYKVELEEEIVSDESGDFKTILRSLLACGRDESVEENIEQATEDAKQLHEAGVAIAGTDESFFNTILCTRSYGQLRMTFDAYKELTGIPIEDAIKEEFSGDTMNGYLALVQAIKDIHGYFADRLHAIMKGPGTDDNSLIRIIVSRSELDLADIKEKYRMNHGKELTEAVADDTSGDYRKILLKIIG